MASSAASTTKSFTDGPAPAFTPVEYLRTLRSRAPGVVFVLERGKNKNVVVFECVKEGGRLKRGNPIDSYWLNVDPEYVSRTRKAGTKHDRTELLVVERWPYGFSTKVTDEPVGRSLELRFDRLPTAVLQVKLNERGECNAFYKADGKQYWVRSVFVDVTESMIPGMTKCNALILRCIDLTTKTACDVRVSHE